MILATPEYLREIANLTSGDRQLYRNACKDAADEIERLRTQCEGLAQSALNNGQELLLFERENERLRDLLAFNGINPDAQVESAKGASKFYGRRHDDKISEGR